MADTTEDAKHEVRLQLYEVGHGEDGPYAVFRTSGLGGIRVRVGDSLALTMDGVWFEVHKADDDGGED